MYFQNAPVCAVNTTVSHKMEQGTGDRRKNKIRQNELRQGSKHGNYNIKRKDNLFYEVLLVCCSVLLLFFLLIVATHYTKKRNTKLRGARKPLSVNRYIKKICLKTVAFFRRPFRRPFGRPCKVKQKQKTLHCQNTIQ